MTTYGIFLLSMSPIGIMGLLWAIDHYERALLRPPSQDDRSRESSRAAVQPTVPAEEWGKGVHASSPNITEPIRPGGQGVPRALDVSTRLRRGSIVARERVEPC
jgi:hypothetical protein